MALSNMEIAAQLDALAVSTAPTASGGTAQSASDASSTPDGGEAGGDSGNESSDSAPELEVKTKDSKRRVSWEEAMKMAPPEMADLMSGLRADYTKKTQELAAQRKEMQREREALARAQEALSQTPDIPDWDPWDESTVNARIEREVARRLAEALQPVREQYETQQSQDAYNAFLTANPDFRTDTALRKEVQNMLEANEALDLETAYWAAKGRLSRTKTVEAEKRAKAERDAQKKAAIVGTGTPRRVGTPVASSRDLKAMSAADIYKLAESMHKR